MIFTQTTIAALVALPVVVQGFTQPIPNSHIQTKTISRSSWKSERRRTLHDYQVENDAMDLVEANENFDNLLDADEQSLAGSPLLVEQTNINLSQSPLVNDINVKTVGEIEITPLMQMNTIESSPAPEDGDLEQPILLKEEAVEYLENDFVKEIVLDAISETSPGNILAEAERTTVQELKESVEVETVEALVAVSQQTALENDSTTRDFPVIPERTVDEIQVETPIPMIGMEPLQMPVEIEIAKPVQEKPKPKEKIEAASLKKIMKFAIPAVGVWLCSPLLSLIDTSAVGLLSGTAQQAALNPAVVITDYAALLIAFLYTGATNLVASAQEKDRGLVGSPKTASSLTTAMQLSTFVGAGLGALLIVSSRQLLKALIGNDAISPEVFAAAMKYVRIRALGMPAAAIIGSAQAGCLGMQDIKSPLYVLLAAALINLFGDMIFVRSSNPFIGGAAGAAWATVFSQYAAVAFFMRWLTTRPTKRNPERVNLTDAIMELTGGTTNKRLNGRQRFKEAIKNRVEDNFAYKSGKKLASTLESFKSKRRRNRPGNSEKELPPTRGFLHGKFRALDLLKFPKKEHAREYMPYVAPVTATQFGRVSSYIAMSHVVASTLGTSSMAAQQVIVSMFYCLTPVADSLSLTAQSFVPLLFEKKASEPRAKALDQTLRNFFKVGWVFGAGMIGAVLCIPFLSKLFTADPSVVALVNSVTPSLIGFFGLHGVLQAAEGMLLAQRDLNFLGTMYGAFFFAVPYFMLRLKSAALGGTRNINLSSVWQIFLGYQVVRAVAWVGRAFQIQRKINKEAAQLQ